MIVINSSPAINLTAALGSLELLADLSRDVVEQVLRLAGE